MEHLIDSSSTAKVATVAPPIWTRAYFAGLFDRSECEIAGQLVTTLSEEDATLVSVVVPRARVSDNDAFRAIVERAYITVRQSVDATAARHIVRMWNHVPGIGDVMAHGVDRYMVFNAGRHTAMSRWFGAGDAVTLARHAPAASGVGNASDAFVVHALALAAPGTPVENPDQVPAYRYSTQYGPVPPCFSRATRIGNGLLLISGTAAITGEATRFEGNLRQQFDLTLRHFRTLIGPGQCGGDPLAQMQHVRVYVPNPRDRKLLETLCDDSFACPIEFQEAALCRRDLLVEIEAVARVG